MTPVSVVIVCKNEVAILANTLQSLQGTTDDIIVYDNGSTDGTQDIARQYQARLHEGPWDGFGATKRRATALAKHDWILSLDADEAIDGELKQSLQRFSPSGNNEVYEIRFKNFFGKQWLRFGEWGNDKHIRLFNRSTVNWNDAPVHEQLVFPGGVRVKKLKGNVLHHTAPDIEKYREKLEKYAALNAKKYREQGRTPGPLKKYAAAFFSFAQNYIFRAGFLDGKAGYRCAALTARYSFNKYRLLEKMRSKEMEGER